MRQYNGSRYLLFKFMIISFILIVLLTVRNDFHSYAADINGGIYFVEENDIGSDNYIWNEEENIIGNFDDAAKINGVSEEFDKITGKYNKKGAVSFKELYDLLLSGDVDEAISTAALLLCDNITNDLSENRDIIVQLVLLVILSAVFSNYSSIMKSGYVSEQGFYITYLMCAALLLKSFSIIYDLAEQTVIYVKEMMECLLPALSMSLVMCGGLTTSRMTNSFFIWMLTLMEKLLLNVLLPAAKIYFYIVLLDQIGEKERFSKLTTLIRQGTLWLLKALITGVAGVNVVKGMIAPVYENVRFNTIQKGINMLPGGGEITGLTSIFLGTGILIKNSIGVAGAVMLMAFGAIPIVKIGVLYISYRLVMAFTQPISDKRVISGIEGACKSIEILLRLSATSIALCVLSIAIVLLSTNIRFYAG